jgi:hypothetical protein
MRNLPYLSIGIQMPVWFIGIEPSDFADIAERYEEMRDVCERNGVACHPFEDAFGEPLALPVDEATGDGTEEPSDDG